MTRLVAHEMAATSDPDPANAAVRVVRRVSGDLSRFIGSDGCHALLVRALSKAQATHAPLRNIRISAKPELTVNGVPESINAHSVAATAAGLEVMLVELIELLRRLIGDELAMKLVELNPDGGSPDDKAAQ